DMFRIDLNADTVMAGAVDAVYGDKIADYKITAVENAPGELYDSQLDFYGYIVHLQKKIDSIKAVTAFLKENTTRERTITDFASIRERIESAAKKCASGSPESYNPNHKHCVKCPFKKGCVKVAGTIQE
ncbi:MAG: PD-(D/E)XK nuclease family protein, partial [Synergistaceae bacterium]|nr:PD-(D/E)XK nuclease family protein [Synergistaceae bacterium]